MMISLLGLFGYSCAEPARLGVAARMEAELARSFELKATLGFVRNVKIVVLSPGDQILTITNCE